MIWSSAALILNSGFPFGSPGIVLFLSFVTKTSSHLCLLVFYHILSEKKGKFIVNIVNLSALRDIQKTPLLRSGRSSPMSIQGSVTRSQATCSPCTRSFRPQEKLGSSPLPTNVLPAPIFSGTIPYRRFPLHNTKELQNNCNFSYFAAPFNIPTICAEPVSGSYRSDAPNDPVGTG